MQVQNVNQSNTEKSKQTRFITWEHASTSCKPTDPYLLAPWVYMMHILAFSQVIKCSQVIDLVCFFFSAFDWLTLCTWCLQLLFAYFFSNPYSPFEIVQFFNYTSLLNFFKSIYGLLSMQMIYRSQFSSCAK